jgi:hypothetical protein
MAEMPDHDDAQRTRRHHEAEPAAQHALAMAERVETWLAQLPELRVLLAWGADAHQVAEALVRAGARLYAMIGEAGRAGRIEDALAPTSVAEKEPVWTQEPPPRALEALAAAIARQTRPNVAAAARVVAAQAPYQAEGVSAEAIRRTWIKLAKRNGITGTELAFRVWQEAQRRTKPPS